MSVLQTGVQVQQLVLSFILQPPYVHHLIYETRDVWRNVGETHSFVGSDEIIRRQAGRSSDPKIAMEFFSRSCRSCFIPRELTAFSQELVRYSATCRLLIDLTANIKNIRCSNLIIDVMRSTTSVRDLRYGFPGFESGPCIFWTLAYEIGHWDERSST